MANLVQFLTAERDAAKAAKDTATQDVAAAKADAATKRTAATAAAAALNAKLQEIAAIKRDLAGIPTSDDGAALVAQLQAAILAAHAAQADTVEKTEAADIADAMVKQRGAELDNGATRLAGLENMLSEAKAAEQTRNQLKQAATAAVQTAAAAALGAAPFTAARTRIEGDFPAKLRARAVASADVVLSKMAITKAVRDRASLALNDKLSAPEKAKKSLELAEGALGDYVKTAPPKLAKALDVFTKVANPAQAPLTAAEKTAIGDKLAEREPAADKAIVLSQKQLALDKAQDVVDAAATPTQAQIDARDTAKTERDAAANDVDAAVKKTLHEWEATVPDANWQMFAEYDGARRDVEFLRDTDPATLVVVVNNAEDALVTAVQAANTAGAGQGAARAAAVRAETVLIASEKLRPVRMLSALRGDF